MNDKDLKFFMDVAIRASEDSYCNNLKVGACIVQERQIISTGRNGTPDGFENKCECSEGKTTPLVIHAEMNAIFKAAKSTVSTKDAFLFSTHSPCVNCAIGIIQCGISRVFYLNAYRDFDGVRLLRKAGIEVFDLSSL